MALQRTLPLLLEDAALNVHKAMWVQFDGSPPNVSFQIHDWFNSHFMTHGSAMGSGHLASVFS
jgi:hypothetical protein